MGVSVCACMENPSPIYDRTTEQVVVAWSDAENRRKDIVHIMQ